ncbi:Bug family tripartite tricarboxylate transporter substrate binding protein [Variovorax sp. PvP013]|uniref:Bug family tripartite tricarboxylate transporter substrate binding protein n=1 Tax=Variovorax sp. PvP013 TaxID=3156435 RepID=UPI003D197C5A
MNSTASFLQLQKFKVTPLRHLACVLFAVAASSPAFAQPSEAFPCPVIKFVVPYPPGGSSDMLARLMVPGLTQRLGTTVVVENKTGAAGNIGTAAVSTSKADGCTWLLGNSTNVVISRNLYQLASDPMAALTPVAEAATVPMVLYVNAQLPVRDVKSFIDDLRAHPGKSYASPGSGTPHHLLGEQLKLDHKLELTHVPYRGSGPAIQDVLAGHVAFAFESTSSIVPHLAGGRIRALATTGDQRSTALPDVPTMKELGFPKFVVTNWYGVFVPKGTPAPLVVRLNTGIHDTLKAPEIAEALTKLDSQNVGYDATQYQQFVKKEGPLWESLVKRTSARVD